MSSCCCSSDCSRSAAAPPDGFTGSPACETQNTLFESQFSNKGLADRSCDHPGRMLRLCI